MEFSFETFKLKVALVAMDGLLGGPIGIGDGDPLLLDPCFLCLASLGVETVAVGGLSLGH